MVRRLLHWQLPVVLSLGCVLLVLHRSGVGDRDTLTFLALQLVAYLIPGLLVWRWLRGRSGSLLLDGTFGLILGHAVTIALYLFCRWVGVPRAIWVFPVVTVAVFASVPALRRHWRPDPARAEPTWMTWGVTVGIGLLCLWYGGLTPMNPVGPPNLLWQSADHLFLLSIAGDARNHVPPTTPYVVDERLNYHWFAMVDVAATSWQSGLEMSTLLFRLQPLWSLLTGFIAFALLAERIGRRKAVGLVALGLAVLAGSVSLLHGATTTVVDSTLLLVNWVGSPTQGFGQVLAIASLYVIVGIVRGEDRGPRPWVLLALLTATLMGAKATFLPVIGAGVALVALVGMMRERRLPGPVVAVGLLLGAELLFAQVVLFGGASQGLVLAPGDDFRVLGASIGVPAATGALTLTAVCACLFFGWFAPLTGAGVLARFPTGDRPALLDPAAILVTGMVVASVGVVVLLAHPGYSEYFFLRSGLPFGYLLVAWGLVAATALVPGRRTVVVLGSAGATGLGLVLLARMLSRRDLSVDGTAWRALVLVVAAIVATGLAGWLGGRLSSGLDRRARLVLTLAAAGACTVGMASVRTVDLARQLPISRGDYSGLPARLRALPVGGIDAARYLRAHTSPDDMLATNAHLRIPNDSTGDARGFWLAAFAERRVVVEGWAYTATANDEAPSPASAFRVPYWNPALLALNDAVFDQPSVGTLRALVGRYPVRWLVVDRRYHADLAGLRSLLPVHRRYGEVTIFRVDPVR
ncbi:MAG: hypothetical protein J7518_11985 [Nocardioidaceae bacterium]|nr:hypothetical protein [Nocardioidaceae bacterium]